MPKVMRSTMGAICAAIPTGLGMEAGECRFIDSREAVDERAVTIDDDDDDDDEEEAVHPQWSKGNWWRRTGRISWEYALRPRKQAANALWEVEYQMLEMAKRISVSLRGDHGHLNG